MYNVFVSYLREDKTQALRLADELQSNGAVVWVDVTDLLIGAPWRKEIAEAIRQAEFFLACFSSTYDKRPDNGMLEELNYAIRLPEAGQKHPEILPVKLNACDIPDLQIDSGRNLNELHWYLLDDQNWEAGVKQLVEITLRMAKEQAKVRLKAEAEEIIVKNSELLQAQEELRTHELAVLRQQTWQQIYRETASQYSTGWHSVELLDVWRAQQVTMRKMEYEYALSQYRKHQLEFIQRFGEEHHPLSELLDKINEETKRIPQSFEDARQAEKARIHQELKEGFVLIILICIVATVLGGILSWLKSVLGF